MKPFNCHIASEYNVISHAFIMHYHIVNLKFTKIFSIPILYNKMAGGLMQLVAYGAQDVYLN